MKTSLFTAVSVENYPYKMLQLHFFVENSVENVDNPPLSTTTTYFTPLGHHYRALSGKFQAFY